MSYIEESLSKGEEVVTIFKLHWFTKIPMFAWATLALLCLVAAFIPDNTSSTSMLSIALIVTCGITLILAIMEYLKLRSIEQGVTNKRVILKTGFIRRNSDEMKISSIETVEINQGIIGRVFGFGSVSVTGKGISDLTYKNIDDPMSVKKAIESVDVMPEEKVELS